MLVSKMFPSKWLQAEDLNPGERVVVTIERVFMGEAKTNAQGEPEVKWKLKFVEHRKAMGLWPSNARIIADMYGEDTDQWPGKKISIYAATYNSYGEIKPCVNVDKWTPDQVRHFQTKPAAANTNGTAPPASLVIAGDKRPIPAEVMDRFTKFAAQHVPAGTSVWDRFLAWCKAHAAEALQMCFGEPMDKIPAGVLPAMKAFLDSLAKPPALDVQKAVPDIKLPTAGAGRETIIAGTGEVVITQPSGAPIPAHMAGQPATVPPDIDEKDIPF